MGVMILYPTRVYNCRYRGLFDRRYDTIVNNYYQVKTIQPLLIKTVTVELSLDN